MHREGHSVLIAIDGEEALQFGRSAEFDIILLDVMMPRIDGVAVLRSLRKERRHTPTIMVTARDPATFMAALAALTAVAAIAGYFPARRASRIDPSIALRSS